MGDTVEAPLRGAVVTKVLANLRQGAPTTQAPVIRKLAAGETVEVVALAVGEAVQGNAHWYHTEGGGYLWSGACGPLNADGAAAAGPNAPSGPASDAGAPAGLNTVPSSSTCPTTMA